MSDFFTPVKLGEMREMFWCHFQTEPRTQLSFSRAADVVRVTNFRIIIIYVFLAKVSSPVWEICGV